ncbi:DUF3558 domain-containing protein [Nocardia farcinica]|uniref:DUF3558 domain-containing protein n=1 Tax=Nocardia farcinica TaxID=37329 RepID=UPI000E1BCD55|nr:DUF3558 domain-containing protein [Nocardia farcinica]
MRIAHRSRVASFAVIAAAVAVTACGTTVDGTPTESAAKPSNAQFNPCTDISDDVLRGTGVDPASKDVVTDAAGPSAWRICSWDAIDLPYYLVVASSINTVADVRNNDKETGFREVAIGPRTGLVHQDKSDTKGTDCRVAIPAEQGMFVISASWRTSETITRDRCELAIGHARDLEPHLPD